MPFLYLSPSTQQFNPYVTSGNEEYWMNLIADDMEPYLRAAGINFTRNDPNTSAAAAIRESNAGTYDFHLALHSNAAGSGSTGTVRGVDVYYYPTSQQGLAMANILADNLREIYPLPDLVRAISTTAIGEVRRTRAPSAFLELGYHDNVADATWVEENTADIARNISLSVTEYFGLPFVEPGPVREGTVTGNSVNFRSLPTTGAPAYRQLPQGTRVTVYGEYDGWYSIGTNGLIGWVDRSFITV